MCDPITSLSGMFHFLLDIDPAYPVIELEGQVSTMNSGKGIHLLGVGKWWFGPEHLSSIALEEEPRASAIRLNLAYILRVIFIFSASKQQTTTINLYTQNSYH